MNKKYSRSGGSVISRSNANIHMPSSCLVLLHSLNISGICLEISLLLRIFGEKDGWIFPCGSLKLNLNLGTRNTHSRNELICRIFWERLEETGQRCKEVCRSKHSLKQSVRSLFRWKKKEKPPDTHHGHSCKNTHKKMLVKVLLRQFMRRLHDVSPHEQKQMPSRRTSHAHKETCLSKCDSIS